MMVFRNYILFATGICWLDLRNENCATGLRVARGSEYLFGNSSSREHFVSSWLREPSVCLCCRIAAVERSVAGCFVRVSGGCYTPGLAQQRLASRIVVM
jgi:hypothetical protein